MDGRILLDVVILEGAVVFKGFSGENKSLLIEGNSFFNLDYGLDFIDGV